MEKINKYRKLFLTFLIIEYSFLITFLIMIFAIPNIKDIWENLTFVGIFVSGVIGLVFFIKYRKLKRNVKTVS